jgi:hypothetical protein
VPEESLRVLKSRTFFRIRSDFEPRSTRRGPGCVLSGSVDNVKLPLLSAPGAREPFAVLERGTLAVKVPATLEAPIEVELIWPFTTTAYVRQDALPLCLQGPVMLEEGVAWLGPCTRVAAAVSADGKVKVARTLAAGPRADFSPPSFEATLSCDSLELARIDNLFPDDAKLKGPSIPRGGEVAELTQSVPISRMPGGRSDLRVGGPDWPVTLHETRGGWALVSERSGTRFDPRGFDFLGWVPVRHVRKGGLRIAMDFGRVEIPPSHRACANAAVRTEPRRDSPVVARLAGGLPLVVIGHEGDFASALIPDTMAVLWVHRSELCVQESR